MKLLILFALVLCTYAADVKEEKEKRQTQEGHLGSQFVYRAARKQEPVAPVEEHQEEEKASIARSDDQYRPGQVFSLNTQELLELQPERKAPVNNNQQLQQLYANPQQDQQDHQQFYFLEPQVGRQVSLQPSHAVITRPIYSSSNGGEASVGAALSVSDTGASSVNSFDQDLLALLGQGQLRQEESRSAQEDPRPQTYPQPQPQPTPTVQSVAPQYQQVDRYVTKSNKKSTKSHTKSQSSDTTSQLPTAPQQYLIETTNVQQPQHQLHESQRQLQEQQHQLQDQQHQLQEQQHQLQEQQHQQVQYRPAPQQQRLPQALRYVPNQSTQAVQQQVLYERPETQGLKIVAAPKLQQPQQHQRPSDNQQQRAQLAYRIVPQYTQPEISSKQYRIVEAPRPQPVRQEHRLTAPSLERPVAYLKRYPEPEKQRSVKIYEPQEQSPQQQVQGGEQYYLRPIYRTNDQRQRYDLPQAPLKAEQQRILEQTKPHSTIYVNKNLAPRKVVRPQPTLREQNAKIDQSSQELSFRSQQASNVENVNIEQHGYNLADQRSNLPPPKNNKAYTPEEFAALVAAGYAVTPVPVSALSLGIAQSRSSEEAVTSHPVMMAIPRGRLGHSRRHQYLPLRGDDAP